MNRQREQTWSDPALKRLAAQPPDKPVVLLHSGRFDAKWATKSLIAQPRAWYRFSLERGSELIADLGFGIADSKSNPQSAIPNPQFTHHLWHDLRELLNHPDLPGKWVGYFSYDLCRVIESGKLQPRAGDWPLVELAWCPEAEEVPSSMFQVPGLRRRDFSPAAVQLETWNMELKTPPPIPHTCLSDFSRAEYESAVRRVLGYIAAGDVFQVNLAQRFTAQYAGNPRELYARLAAISPAWYGAYLELPARGDQSPGIPIPGRSSTPRFLLSTSPELFLQLHDNHVTTRPIKGTRPNPRSPIPDPHYHDLLHSAKDIAELNMIVDLMRNDLGRVCSYGSVRVTEPRTIESHPTVHHGVATIEGDLHPTMDVVDLLRAALPGGSVTGAPKVRAMQVIDELEPVPRGPYCGAIGWVTKDGLQLNVAIRTMAMEEGRVSFSVGGGVVADSDPAAEYEETITKAQAMMRALGSTA